MRQRSRPHTIVDADADRVCESCMSASSRGRCPRVWSRSRADFRDPSKMTGAWSWPLPPSYRPGWNSTWPFDRSCSISGRPTRSPQAGGGSRSTGSHWTGMFRSSFRPWTSAGCLGGAAALTLGFVFWRWRRSANRASACDKGAWRDGSAMALDPPPEALRRDRGPAPRRGHLRWRSYTSHWAAWIGCASCSAFTRQTERRGLVRTCRGTLHRREGSTDHLHPALGSEWKVGLCS